VDLQALLDKTAPRIIMAQKNVIDIVLDDTSKEFVLISKWGCDGSTGHSEYNNGHWKMLVTVIFLSHM
jgi:hypothetical protein